jgi:hypothetical protein
MPPVPQAPLEEQGGGSIGAPPAASTSIATAGLPRWLVTLAIVLPSIALLAVVAWLLSSGVRPGAEPAPGEPPAGRELAAQPGNQPAGPPGAPAPGDDTDVVAADPTPRDRFAARASRSGERVEGLIGVPQQLQELMASGQVRTARLHVELPYPVALRIAPAVRAAMVNEQIRERLQNATPEQRRQFAAGFLLEQAAAHDVELPVGNWRVTVMAPRVLLYREEQVMLRPGQAVRLDQRLPRELVQVAISSDPAGGRFREGRLPYLATPFEGPVVVGDHRFEFVWGDRRAMVDVAVARAGQQIVGRQRPD